MASVSYSGQVSGNLQTFQHQGGFCNNSPEKRDAFGWRLNNCEGALFNDEEAETYVGVARAKVKLYSNDGTLMGSGETNDFGNFQFYWSVGPSTGYGLARLWMYTEQSEGRVKVTNLTSSSPLQYFVGQFDMNPDSNTWIGSWAWGTPSVPDKYTNVYDGAIRLWRSSLITSNKMLSLFTGIRIKCFEGPAFGANSAGKLIRIGDDQVRPFTPQTIVMHEMGHIVQSLSDSHHKFSNSAGYYMWPQTGASGPTPMPIANHNEISPEWQAAAFEEGFANFVADTGLYTDQSFAGVTCSFVGIPCPEGELYLEYSTALLLGCPFNNLGDKANWQDSSRWEISTENYLWDIFDSNIDNVVGGSCNGLPAGTQFSDNINRPFFEFVDTLGNYVKGLANHQTDEPFSSTSYSDSSVVRRDGRSHRDFRWNFQNRHPTLGIGGPDTASLLCMTCVEPTVDP